MALVRKYAIWVARPHAGVPAGWLSDKEGIRLFDSENPARAILFDWPRGVRASVVLYSVAEEEGQLV